MVDIASLKDGRGIYLDEAGITNLSIPIAVKDKSEKRDVQHTIGTFNASVELDADNKGTHMSRIVEVVYEHRKDINQKGLDKLVKDLILKLEAVRSKVEVRFPYFIDRYSPVTNLHNMMTYNARFTTTAFMEWVSSDIVETDFMIGVDVDIMTVCPCALEECQTGASHVQRGQVKIDVKVKKGTWVWLEDLIDIAEKAGSSPVYERLKRKDEKQVVLNGFKKPQFVEDVVRDVVVSLRELDGIDGYNVSCENYESIHQHNAYARRYTNWNLNI